MKAISIVTVIVAVSFVFLFGVILAGCGKRGDLEAPVGLVFQPLEEMGGEG